MRPGFDYIAITTPFFCHDGYGNFVLHKRSVNTRDEHGRWDFGGGKLEHGLSLEENVLKEVAEEYGCTATIQEKLPALTILRIIDEVQSHWIAVPFVLQVNPSEVKINEPDMADEIGWFRIDALPSPMHSAYTRALPLLMPHLTKYMQIAPEKILI